MSLGAVPDRPRRCGGASQLVAFQSVACLHAGDAVVSGKMLKRENAFRSRCGAAQSWPQWLQVSGRRAGDEPYPSL